MKLPALSCLMGHSQCFSKHLNPFELVERRRELLKFFQIASEDEIINRYPCLGESLAHNIILKRRKAPLKRLRDVWNLEAVRTQLLSVCGVVSDDSIRSETEINEIPPRAISVIETSHRNPVLDAIPPNLPPIAPTHHHYQSSMQLPLTQPSAPPPPPADYAVTELFTVLNRTGLIDRWKKYLNNDQILSVSDSHPSTTYRLATWNLNRLSASKAKYPGILEAICLTILSHQFDLIAFQEIVEPEAVQLLVDELNSPKLPMIKRWMAVNQVKSGNFAGFSSTEKTGRTFQAVEYSSFLYRSDRLKAISSRILEIADDNERPFSRLPFMSKFKIGSNTLILTSVHLKAPTLHESKSVKNSEEISCLANFVDALNDTLSDHIYYVILGDFNLDPGNEAFDAFRSRGLTSVLPTACATMSSAVERGAGIGRHAGAHSRSVPSLDNAWLCRSLITHSAASSSNSPVSGETGNVMGSPNGDSKSCPSAGLHFTGLSAVAVPVRHPLIPSTDFSDDCGSPSDHCPIYFDLEIRDNN